MLRNHHDTSLLVLSTASCVIVHKLGHHYRVAAAPLAGTRHSNPSRVTWTGHSLRRGAASASHAFGVSFTVIMAWGLWKSLASPFLYIDVSVRPSSEALFFGHLLTRFNLPQAPHLRQATPTAVSSSIDLSDAFEALLEFDDWRHRSPLGQLRVVLINNCIGNFDLTSAIRDRSSKVEIADYSMYSTFLTASPGSVLFSRSNLLKKKGSVLLVPQARPYKAS